MNQYKRWERDVAVWQTRKDFGPLIECPEKPGGYDLWKQGEEVLIKGKEKIFCKGGNLVENHWVTSKVGPTTNNKTWTQQLKKKK